MLDLTMRLQRKGCAFGVGTVVACLLAACSGKSDTAQSTTDLVRIDPCSVLQASDIQSAFGAAPAAPGKRDNMGVVDNCTWSLSSGPDINVSFYNPVGAATTYKPVISPQTPRDKTYETVSGLGDNAVYRDDSRPPAINVSLIVEVVKGMRHFDVHYVDALAKGSGPSKDTMVSLARTVLGRVQ